MKAKKKKTIELLEMIGVNSGVIKSKVPLLPSIYGDC